MGATRRCPWISSPATPAPECSSAASASTSSRRSSLLVARSAPGAGATWFFSTSARARTSRAPAWLRPPTSIGSSGATRSAARTARSSPSATATTASRATADRNTRGGLMARTIIVQAEEQVACPKCSQRFRLSEGLSRQAIERHAGEFERAVAEGRKELEGRLAAEAKAHYETQAKALSEALAAKERAMTRFRDEELGLRRQLRELEEAKKNQDLEYQRRLDAERKKIEEQARSTVNDEVGRREAQWKAQLDSAQREAADLKRKLEQGSQQLQGEALELSLEALLRTSFPLDEILPVPKGVNGADLIQRVRSPTGLVCGTILWEAKQTKAWQPAWLRKLKDEQQEIGAEFAVIVTASMPKDRSGNCGEPFLRDSDVGITRHDAARPLAELLRCALLELAKQRQANLGRSEKMEVLYSDIRSPQFAGRLKSLYDGFVVMREELEAEKAAFARIWKKREAQLTRMQDGLLSVVGDLQGIGEEAVPALEVIAALPAEREMEPTTAPSGLAIGGESSRI